MTGPACILMHNEVIRQVLRDTARLPVAVDDIADDDDLYLAGMTSLASVNVMLALEDTLEIEFPERLLKKATFASIAAISEALEAISGAQLR
jgi:acyl carrier protein